MNVLIQQVNPISTVHPVALYVDVYRSHDVRSGDGWNSFKPQTLSTNFSARLSGPIMASEVETG